MERDLEKLCENLIGREFDWFARDCNGNYGLFSSAGSINIPKKVLIDYKNHDEIAQEFDLPNHGSEKVWQDLANYGFFVYDWQLHDGLYKRMSKPNSKMSENLKNKLSKIESLLEIDLSFENKKEITSFEILENPNTKP